MGVQPILFQNSRGIVLAHFPGYETSNMKCSKISYFAIFKHEPELSINRKIINITKLKLNVGRNNDLTPYDCVKKVCKLHGTALLNSGCRS